MMTFIAAFDQLAIQFTKLKLGIGDDNPKGAGVLSSLEVDLQALLLHLICPLLAQDFNHGLEGDVFIMAFFSLGRWREDRLWKLA